MVRPTSPAHAPRLTIYRTEHFRPLAPNPSTSPSAEVRDLGPRRAISGDLGASLARAAAAHLVAQKAVRSAGLGKEPAIYFEGGGVMGLWDWQVTYTHRVRIPERA